jgi:hypothetical protein
MDYIVARFGLSSTLTTEGRYLPDTVVPRPFDGVRALRVNSAQYLLCLQRRVDRVK